MGAQQITYYKIGGWSDPDPKLIIPDPANNFGSGSGSTTLVGAFQSYLGKPEKYFT